MCDVTDKRCSDADLVETKLRHRQALSFIGRQRAERDSIRHRKPSQQRASKRCTGHHATHTLNPPGPWAARGRRRRTQAVTTRQLPHRKFQLKARETSIEMMALSSSSSFVPWALALFSWRGDKCQAIEAAEQAPPEDDARPALHAARRRAAQGAPSMDPRARHGSSACWSVKLSSITETVHLTRI